MSKPSERLQEYGMKETISKLKYYFVGLAIGIALGITIGIGIN
jgi:hypothetical protein